MTRVELGVSRPQARSLEGPNLYGARFSSYCGGTLQSQVNRLNKSWEGARFARPFYYCTGFSGLRLRRALGANTSFHVSSRFHVFTLRILGHVPRLTPPAIDQQSSHRSSRGGPPGFAPARCLSSCSFFLSRENLQAIGSQR